ncbi:protein MMS22-like isoform X2 [Bombus vosnesenskii]|uniref:Protein MMS22-like n=1 Tax=Bombus vosnesenskii TaxID=207650 RepID=A0A6J3LLR7_9HYME|nr:protein MMS22-like isoform X2 [Bombus vosnesenskii]
MDFCLTFNCNGKVNLNDWELDKNGLFSRGEVEKVLYPQDECLSSEKNIQLFNYTVPFTTALLDLKHFNKCMNMQLKILSRHETYNQVLSSKADDIDFYYVRCIISEFILYIRIYLNSIKGNYQSLQVINENIEEEFNELFVIIKHFLERIHNIPDTTFHYAPSKLGNQCTQLEYHMYHMHIELRWFFISLMYTKHIYSQYSIENHLDEFENVQAMIINDLIYISLKIFETMPLTQIQQKTPYNCTCIRELWLMLQIFIDSLSDRMKSKSFWEYINECINRLLNRNVSNNNKDFLTFCKNSELFCLWIVHHLSLLYGYNSDGIYLGSKCSRIRPNYEQVERILKIYISKGGKDGERDEIDEELCIMIPLLNTIVTNWWHPQVSIISLLWDCFHKRLDEPFLLQVSGPWTLSVEKKTTMDLLKQVKDRITNTEYIKESSYGMFLRLLGSFLRINYNNNDTKHWNQIKGRIYSKFSKGKVEEFSTTGLYNFLSLFLTLAVTADTTNVCSVMLDLLPLSKEYNNENGKKHNLIWKGKLTVLLLYNDLKLNLANIASLYINTVNIICCRKDDTSRIMMNNFIDVFSTILSSTNIGLGKYLLFSGWIDRYLLECSNKMVGTLMKVLINVFESCIYLAKTSNTGDVEQMLDALWCYVASRVRQLVFDPALTNVHFEDISKLAVLFTLEALKNPATAKKYKHSATTLFQHFASSVIVKDIRITRHYLTLILKQDQAIQDLKKEIKNFDTIIIQAWIKCSIIGHDTNRNEIKVLQNYILQLEDIQKIFETSNDIQEFQNNDESILMFIMHSMKKRSTLKTEQERIQYDIKWRLYFNHLEKWILLPIMEETKDSELALWIYRCIGTLILCTSIMLYSKNQPNNIFKTLLNKTILSVEHNFLKNLGKKTFSMILLGMETLNVKSDISLQVLIRDLFDQYMPFLIIPTTNANTFKVSDSLLKCFKDAKADYIRLILEILMTNFFNVSNDNMMHKHFYLVMILLQNLLKDEINYACHIVESIIVICTSYIIGCYVKVHDHHPHKQQTIDFINNIIRNRYYKENNSLQDKFYNIISSSVKKSLIINQHNTFELLRSILPISTEMVQFLSSELEYTLNDLEIHRRPNAASFRYCWNQLRNLMKSNMTNH